MKAGGKTNGAPTGGTCPASGFSRPVDTASGDDYEQSEDRRRGDGESSPVRSARGGLIVRVTPRGVVRTGDGRVREFRADERHEDDGSQLRKRSTKNAAQRPDPIAQVGAVIAVLDVMFHRLAPERR
jgi:hypothetical protein